MMTTTAIPLTRPGVVAHTSHDAKRESPVSDGGLLGAIRDADVSLISFDVFDTVLTRDVGEPFALFYQIGAEVAARKLVDCNPLIFVQVRYANEKRARTNRDGREVTLREIYEEVAQVFNCEDRIDELMEIEMEVEGRSLRLVPQALRAVEEARARFGRVIFISDMYLPSDFIRSLLKDKGLFRSGDALYLSSDFGVQKGDGRLFRKVLADEGIPAKRLMHCGDSVCYDIEPARKLGIRTFHSTIAVPHPSEQALSRRTSWNGGFGSGLAGASRLARLGCPESDPLRKTMWETGATVTGPFVLLYAQWILDRCAKLGIRDIWFLARDGYFPYLAVKELLAGNPRSPFEVRYIHGSRPTYQALGVKRLGEREWDDLTKHGGSSVRTIRDLASALMASDETLTRHLPSLGFEESDHERELSDDEIDVIRRAAVGDTAFNRDLESDLREYQDRMRRYFGAQGFDADLGIALVDTGWTTRSHAPLYEFLKEMGCRNLKLMYIGVMVEDTHVPLDSVEAFVFDMARKRGPISRQIYYARPCEALLFARHGRTTGFEERGGEIVPVLAPPENPKAIASGFDSYERGVRAFLGQVMSEVEGSPPPFGVADLAQQVISRFWREPTKAEAIAWSRMEWQWDPQGRVTYPFARRYRWSDLWAAFVQQRCPQCYPQFWVAGSAALSDTRILFALKAAGKVSRVARKFVKGLPDPVRRVLRKGRRLVNRGGEPGTLSAGAMMAMEIAPYLAK